jgi:hypothetical protein
MVLFFNQTRLIDNYVIWEKAGHHTPPLSQTMLCLMSTDGMTDYRRDLEFLIRFIAL